MAYIPTISQNICTKSWTFVEIYQIIQIRYSMKNDEVDKV
jgi:hypothetical protein